MAEEKIAGKPADRPHQESGFRPKGHAGNHDNGRHGLEMINHPKSRPGGNRDGAQDRQHHQFLGLRLPVLKHQEEGNHGIQNDQHTGQIVHPATGPVTQIDGSGHHQQQHDEGQPSAPVPVSVMCHRRPLLRWRGIAPPHAPPSLHSGTCTGSCGWPLWCRSCFAQKSGGGARW